MIIQEKNAKLRDGGGAERERSLTHLFVHFNVKAVGHFVILKQRRISVNRHERRE